MFLQVDALLGILQFFQMRVLAKNKVLALSSHYGQHSSSVPNIFVKVFIALPSHIFYYLKTQNLYAIFIPYYQGLGLFMQLGFLMMHSPLRQGLCIHSKCARFRPVLTPLPPCVHRVCIWMTPPLCARTTQADPSHLG